MLAAIRHAGNHMDLRRTLEALRLIWGSPKEISLRRDLGFLSYPARVFSIVTARRAQNFGLSLAVLAPPVISEAVSRDTR